MFAEMPAIDGDGVLTFKLLPDRFGPATVKFLAKDDGGLEDYGLQPGTHRSRRTTRPTASRSRSR